MSAILACFLGYPPRTRGSTAALQALDYLLRVSPAHAGIDLSKPGRNNCRGGIPRADLERLIGREALSTLAQVAGGLDLYIPAKVPMDGPLLELPLAAQERLARYAGGTRLYIPMLCGELRRIRDARIRAAYDAGERVQDIARRFRLSERRVWAILGSPEPQDEAQASLF